MMIVNRTLMRNLKLKPFFHHRRVRSRPSPVNSEISAIFSREESEEEERNEEKVINFSILSFSQCFIIYCTIEEDGTRRRVDESPKKEIKLF